MIEVKQSRGNLIETVASDKLTKEDYDYIIPRLEKKLEEHGKLRWLFEMDDFHGWELQAMWRDLKFDVQHANDFEKIAMVGNKKWEELMTDVMKPFTSGEVRYFDHSEKLEAETWIKN